MQDVRDQHRDELDAIPDAVDRVDRLCELNVAAQVRHVSETTVVRDAWLRGQALTVHGCIYRLQDGILRDLGVSMGL